MRLGGAGTALLLALLLAPCGFGARVPGDAGTQQLLPSGMHVLSPLSAHAPASVDLGLPPGARQEAPEQQQQQQQRRRWWRWWAARRRRRQQHTPLPADPLADPSLATVFASDSVFARRATAAAAAASTATAASAAAAPGGAGGAAGFAARAKDAAFDLRRATQLAQLNSIAYCAALDDVAAWNCSRCGAIPGFRPYLVHFDEGWDLLGYAGYWPAANAKVLVFRGTDSSSWYNWAENMRTWTTDATVRLPGAPASLRIHSGFLLMWNASSMAAAFGAAYEAMLADHPDGPTVVIGHSMGGALAQLAALDVALRYGQADVSVVTFGAPRVGNAVFASFVDATVASCWRFTHGRDLVPSLPPLLMGFRHVSREVWLLDVEAPGAPGNVSERVMVCDDSGEDPTCHNAACRLGLCTSVADHLTYLGAHMYRGGEC